MLPVAVEMRQEGMAATATLQFETLRAAIGSFFDKEGNVAKGFREALKVMGSGKKSKKGDAQDAADDPAETMLKGFSKMLGVGIPSSKKKRK